MNKIVNLNKYKKSPLNEDVLTGILCVDRMPVRSFRQIARTNHKHTNTYKLSPSNNKKDFLFTNKKRT